MMTLRIPFLFSVLMAATFAQKSATPSGSGDVIMMEFPTSVRQQLAEPGVLRAFQSAASVSVQLISSPDNQNAIDDEGKIQEGIIHLESERRMLSSEERQLLFRVLSEDTPYEESRAPCLCFFTPQLRAAFDDPRTKKHYDVFLSGVSHGEIRATEGGREVAYTRSWRFIPRYLILMDRLFPDHSITKMLHEYHQSRMKTLAKQAREETTTAPTPTAGQPLCGRSVLVMTIQGKLVYCCGIIQVDDLLDMSWNIADVRTKPGGNEDLGGGFMIALHEGPADAPTVDLKFDLPADLQSEDLSRFKKITKWEDIREATVD